MSHKGKGMPIAFILSQIHMKKLYTIAFLLTVFAACKKDSNTTISTDPKEGLIKVSEGYALGAATRIELWSQTSITTGYHKLFLALYDSLSNRSITKAAIAVLPVMDMDMNGMQMSHAAPCYQPESNIAENTLFPCAAVFTMPGTVGQSKWSFKVTVKKEGQDRSAIALLPIDVKASLPARVKMISTADGTKLVVSCFFPVPPKIGINEVELSIHRQQDKMTFLPVDDYAVLMTPEMPAMGHGSPNNINPVVTKNGPYKGKVNFTMSGEWRINFGLTKAGQNLNTFFDLTF